MSETIEMKALRRFQDMDGQAVKPRQKDDEFTVTSMKRATALEAAGKAKIVSPKTEDKPTKGKKGA